MKNEQCRKDTPGKETRIFKIVEAWNAMKSLSNFKLFNIGGAFGAGFYGHRDK